MSTEAIAILAALLGGIFILGQYLNSQGAFNPLNIAEYARTAGFTGADLVTAVAIAFAESSGNPKAIGDNGTSYGLWQIHYTVHPETYVNSPDELFDPQTNANAAYMIYVAAGNSFHPWTTFTHGTYAKFLPQAETEISA